MTEGLKQHLPIIVVVSLVGLGTAAFALHNVLMGVGSMNVDTFNTLIIVIPCAIMLVCSFIIAFTASEIGRQLYLTVVGISVVLGIVSMILTSMWASDPTIATALLANSGEGATLIPATGAPVIVIRDIAAYFVVPTIGCILGAWVGSRVHPMTSSKKNKGKKKAK